MSNQHNAARKKQSIQNWAAGLTLPFLLAGGMNLATPAFAANDTEAPQGQQEVKNPRIAAIQTERVTLENGFRALLIHDPYANESAAAMAVGSIGGLYEKRFGVMHFFEHMKFTPEYTQFIRANGGMTNAYTTEDHENFGFTIGTHALPEQMERFSVFFKIPSYDAGKTQDETSAVHNEYMMRFRDDGARIDAVGKKLSEPGHPYNNFVVGSKDTLAGVTVNELLEIDRKFMSADQMALVVISDMPLAQQRELVEKNFSGIPRFDVELSPISKDFRKPLDESYRLVNIQPIEDVHYMKLEFPTTSLQENHVNKPHDILESILNYSGERTLIARLREEGLALEIGAGAGSVHKNVNLFSIQMELTRKGIEQYKKVLDITYDYLNFIRKEGVPEKFVQENQRMAQLGYDWRSPKEGLGYAFAEAQKLLEYGLDDVERMPYLIGAYDPEAYKAVLDTLNPANMTVYLVDQSVSADKEEKYFSVPYSYQKVGGENFASLTKSSGTSEFKYPKANRLIPDNLSLAKEVPHFAINNENARVRFMHDNTFKVPKALMTLTVQTPLASNTAKNRVMAELYVRSVGMSMESNMAPYEAAGMSMKIGSKGGYGGGIWSVDPEGMKLSIGGYTQHLHEMIGVAAKGLKQININEVLFEDLKESLLLELQNKEQSGADERAGDYQGVIVGKNSHLDSEYIKALSEVTLQDVKDFVHKLYAETFIEGSAYGNWNDSDVQRVIETLNKTLESAPLPENRRPKKELDIPAAGQHPRFSIDVEDNNFAYREYNFIGQATPERQVAADLLTAVLGGMGGDYFNELREKKQFGYSVQHATVKKNNELISIFSVVSSTHSPTVLDSETQKWKKERAINLVKAIPDRIFEMYKKGLAKQYEAHPHSIEAMHGFLYGAMKEENGNYNYLEDLQSALKNLTKEQVIVLAEKMLTDPSTPSVTVHVRAKESSDPVPPGVITCDNAETGGDAKTADWIRSKACELSAPGGMK